MINCTTENKHTLRISRINTG